MSDYTISSVADAPDVFGGDYPGAGSAVRVAPAVTRSIWNDGPGDAELVICSIRLDDPHADGELVDGFWPADAAP